MSIASSGIIFATLRATNLGPDRIAPLVASLVPLWPAIRQELAAFARFWPIWPGSRPGRAAKVGCHRVEARLTCSCPQMPTQLYQLPVDCYEILG